MLGFQNGLLGRRNGLIGWTGHVLWISEEVDRQTANIDIRNLVAGIKRAVAIGVGKAMAQMSTPSVSMALNDANMGQRMQRLRARESGRHLFTKEPAFDLIEIKSTGSLSV